MKAWWDKGKWVVKTGKGLLPIVGWVWKAHDIAKWVDSYWGNYPPPERVKTQYQFGPNSIIYQHPGDIWAPYPPVGYGVGGERI